MARTTFEVIELTIIHSLIICPACWVKPGIRYNASWRQCMFNYVTRKSECVSTSSILSLFTWSNLCQIFMNSIICWCILYRIWTNSVVTKIKVVIFFFCLDEFEDVLSHTTLHYKHPFNFNSDFIKLHFGRKKQRNVSYGEFTQLIHVSRPCIICS